MFTRLLDSLHIAPILIAWDTTTISKMGPTIAVVLLKLKVPRLNLLVGLAPHRAN
jgi:hypothetical protein